MSRPDSSTMRRPQEIMLTVYISKTHLQFYISAKQLVPIPVEVTVHLTAVPALAASGTLLQLVHVLVRSARVAGRIVTALSILVFSLKCFLGRGVKFLCRIRL